MSSGRVVVLSGPSGVGKDTVIDGWRERNPRVRRVITYTTREPRDGEINGVNYHFVDEDTFMRFAKGDKFLEYKRVHDNWYASPLEDVRKMVEDGLIAVLKIDVQGALDAMKKLNGELTVFLMPPSIEELEERIRGRHTDTEEQIKVRLKNAHEEMSQRNRYKHVIVNDDVERAVDELEALVA